MIQPFHEILGGRSGVAANLPLVTVFAVFEMVKEDGIRKHYFSASIELAKRAAKWEPGAWAMVTPLTTCQSYPSLLAT